MKITSRESIGSVLDSFAFPLDLAQIAMELLEVAKKTLGNGGVKQWPLGCSKESKRSGIKKNLDFNNISHN